MRWPRFVIVLVLTALVQAGLVDTIAVTPLRVTPDLPLILMVFFATRCNIYEAIISSFAIGFAADIIAMGYPMGPRIISFGLLGTAMGYLQRVIAIKKMGQEALALLVVCFLTGMLTMLLSAFVKQMPTPGALWVLLGTSVYSAAAGPLLFLLLGVLMRLKPRRRGSE